MIDKALLEEDRKFQEETRRVQLFAQRSQVSLYLVLAAVTFSPLLSFFLYFNSAKTALDERFSELTTVITKAASSQIDPYSHALIVAGRGTANAEYSQLTSRLSALHSSIPQIDHLTTLVIIDEQIFTIIDTTQNPAIPPTGQNPSAPGFMTPYSGENAEALKAYMKPGNDAVDAREPFVSESASDIENCLSLPPVPDAYPTLVCVDVTASAYFEQRNRMRNSFFLASLLIFAITVFILYSVVQHQRQVKLTMSLLRKQRDYFLKSSRTDALTGVMNRRAFQRSYAVAEAQLHRNRIAFAVIAIDIDNFKAINDTYGHDAGDKVLVTLVAELSRVLRKNDYLARMGGEEFCVLCTLSEPGQAFIVAEKLRRTVEAIKVPLKNTSFIKFTISLGIHIVEPGQTMEEALKAADIAMYSAKSSGRNRSVFYTKGMEDSMLNANFSKPSPVESEKTLDWAD
jgi:diguanylate cyclase (GGDEF)-like protein